jgi:hypothetical protein
MQTQPVLYNSLPSAAQMYNELIAWPKLDNTVKNHLLALRQNSSTILFCQLQSLWLNMKSMKQKLQNPQNTQLIYNSQQFNPSLPLTNRLSYNQSAQPIQPTQPTQRTQSTRSTQSTEPNQFNQTTQSTQSTETTEPTEPNQFNQTTQSAEVNNLIFNTADSKRSNAESSKVFIDLKPYLTSLSSNNQEYQYYPEHHGLTYVEKLKCDDASWSNNFTHVRKEIEKTTPNYFPNETYRDLTVTIWQFAALFLVQTFKENKKDINFQNKNINLLFEEVEGQTDNFKFYKSTELKKIFQGYKNKNWFNFILPVAVEFKNNTRHIVFYIKFAKKILILPKANLYLYDSAPSPTDPTELNEIKKRYQTIIKKIKQQWSDEMGTTLDSSNIKIPTKPIFLQIKEETQENILTWAGIDAILYAHLLLMGASNDQARGQAQSQTYNFYQQYNLYITIWTEALRFNSLYVAISTKTLEENKDSILQRKSKQICYTSWNAYFNSFQNPFSANHSKIIERVFAHPSVLLRFATGNQDSTGTSKSVLDYLKNNGFFLAEELHLLEWIQAQQLLLAIQTLDYFFSATNDEGQFIKPQNFATFFSNLEFVPLQFLDPQFFLVWPQMANEFEVWMNNRFPMLKPEDQQKYNFLNALWVPGTDNSYATPTPEYVLMSFGINVCNSFSDGGTWSAYNNENGKLWMQANNLSDVDPFPENLTMRDILLGQGHDLEKCIIKWEQHKKQQYFAARSKEILLRVQLWFTLNPGCLVWN